MLYFPRNRSITRYFSFTSFQLRTENFAATPPAFAALPTPCAVFLLRCPAPCGTRGGWATWSNTRPGRGRASTCPWGTGRSSAGHLCCAPWGTAPAGPTPFTRKGAWTPPWSGTRAATAKGWTPAGKRPCAGPRGGLYKGPGAYVCLPGGGADKKTRKIPMKFSIQYLFKEV